MSNAERSVVCILILLCSVLNCAPKRPQVFNATAIQLQGLWDLAKAGVGRAVNMWHESFRDVPAKMIIFLVPAIPPAKMMKIGWFMYSTQFFFYHLVYWPIQHYFGSSDVQKRCTYWMNLCVWSLGPTFLCFHGGHHGFVQWERRLHGSGGSFPIIKPQEPLFSLNLICAYIMKLDKVPHPMTESIHPRVSPIHNLYSLFLDANRGTQLMHSPTVAGDAFPTGTIILTAAIVSS